MKCTDIVTTVGRKYLTANIENDKFSYQKALKETAYIPTAKVGGFTLLFGNCVKKRNYLQIAKSTPFVL